MIRQWLLWTLLPLLFCLTLGGEARALSCDITQTDLNFGAPFNIFTEAPSTAGSFTVKCPALASTDYARVCIGFPRDIGMEGYRLDKGLTYQIYTDASLSTSWQTFGANWPYVDISSSTQIITRNFYAAIFPGQIGVPVGLQSGTVKTRVLVYSYSASGTAPSCDSTTGAKLIYPPTSTASAEIKATCTISATNMTFPSQTIITTDVLAENRLTIQCTMDADYWVSLDNGLYDGGSGQRRMKHDTKENYIDYDLFRDSSRVSRWGRVVKGVDPALGTCNCATGHTANIAVYGKIPKPDISPHAGLYKDTITATVEF